MSAPNPFTGQYLTVEFLKFLQERDAARKEQNMADPKIGAASICMGCGRNTHTGYYPQLHIYRRELCGQCGDIYERWLTEFGVR